MTASDHALAVWRTRLSSAFRTAVACAIVGGTTLYGPKTLSSKLTFPAFSYVTAILIVSDATLGDTLRGCWHALCATAQVVPVAILGLWLIGPGRLNEGVAALAVGLGAFLVALPTSTHLMAKRLAFGQIVIVCVGAVIHGKQTGVVMHPIHVALSTALGALASVLALLLPYPRLACFEVRKLRLLYTQNASKRISLFIDAFSAQDNDTALDTISQAKPLAETAAKLLRRIKLLQEGEQWERPQMRPSKPHFRNPADRLQDMEIPIRGMEIALSACPSFPVGIMDQELAEVLLGVEQQISLKLEQAKCFLTSCATTAPEANGEAFDVLPEPLRTIRYRNSEDLAAIFFVFCTRLLRDESAITRNPKSIFDRSNEEESRDSLEEAKCTFKRICSRWWCPIPKNETLLFAFKCALSLGLAVFFGLIFDSENGYWSGLTIAISFVAERQATFTVANARAQGTAIGSVYGVLGCFFFRTCAEARILALLPWIVFTSFLRHSRMYGQGGGISAVIGALLILGRKNYGPPAEFAIARLSEAMIGLFCFITVELLLQPTRAATQAKSKLSQSLRALRTCIGEVGLSSNLKDIRIPLVFQMQKQNQEKLKTAVRELKKLAGEAELEPNFWFSPFRIACYNKLLDSVSRMADLLLFMTYTMELLVDASQRHRIAWQELQEQMNRELELFKKNICFQLYCLQKITLIESFAEFEREAQSKKTYNLELGKSSDTCRMCRDKEAAKKIVNSFLKHSKKVSDEIWSQEGEELSKTQMEFCLTAIGFCISDLVRETTEIEKGVKELIQWENPSSRLIFCKIYHEINDLNPE